MPRLLRSEQFDPNQICVVHLVQRCVRRAFLAGCDSVTGKDYNFRREWIRVRMERLASVFGIDVLTYAILSNHMHLVVRNRPDVVAQWTDHEVAIRWLRVFPGRRLEEHLAEPNIADVNALASNSERIQLIRKRLSDPSWFMRALSEPIARLANKQDGCTGSFWEGRFKAQTILDEAGLLACSMYVDLNPIRAAMATTVESSQHTSAHDRLHALRGSMIPSAAAELIPVSLEESCLRKRTVGLDDLRRMKAAEQSRKGHKILQDAWLAPLSLGKTVVEGPQASTSGVRASDRGFLTFQVTEYVQLLNWTAQYGSKAQSSMMTGELGSLLSSIGVSGEKWCDLVWNFKKYFGRGGAAGRPKSLKENATRNDRKFRRGQVAAAACFVSS